jgi:hypothetical protein
MAKQIKLSAPPVTESTRSIDITPVGLSTPEGSERVNAALKAWEESHVRVANEASQFITKYSDYIEAAMVRAEDPDSVAEYKELWTVMCERERLQNEFLRAMAGLPKREGTIQ